jgi:hypothetical protein
LTYLGFLLREKLAAVLIIPFSWGSQLASHLLHQLHANKFSSTIQYRAINKFFWRRSWGKRRLLQGEFRTHILYFVLSLLYFTFTCFILSKTQKKLVSFIVAFIYLLLVLLE